MNTSDIIFRTAVSDQWIDYNDHMTEHAYSLVFGLGTDALARRLGVSSDYRERTGCTIYTLTSQIHVLREVARSAELEVDFLVLDSTPSVIHLFQNMYDGERRLKATYEGLIAHVDQNPTPRITPFPKRVQAMNYLLVSAHVGSHHINMRPILAPGHHWSSWIMLALRSLLLLEMLRTLTTKPFLKRADVALPITGHKCPAALNRLVDLACLKKHESGAMDGVAVHS